MDRRLKEVDKQLEELSHHHTSLVEQTQLAFSELRKIQEQKEKVCVFVFVCVCVCVCVCVYVVSFSVCVNTLDATRHLSGVRTYSPHTPCATYVARSQVCGSATHHLSGA